MKPRHARCAAWVAALAMALHALWPLIAQARPATLVPVCTVSDVTHYIELPGKPAPADSHHDHCSFCATVLPQQDVVPTVDVYSQPKPEICSFEPKTFSIVEADARAPPVFPLVLSINDYGTNHEKAFAFRAARAHLGGSVLRLGVLHG